MDTGKPKVVHTNVPGSTPIVLPKSKPVERPIKVPNWPTKKPATVPSKPG